jgi:hypothetical protein
MHGEGIIAYSILTGESGKKTLLGRFRRRLKDNIEIDLKQIACQDVDWIHVA